MTSSYLLDTHVWLWYARGDMQRLPPPLAGQLTELDRAGRLYLSVISVWELGLLTAKGRIYLGQDCLAWVRIFLDRTRFRLLELDMETAVQANRLPGNFHSDPVDRLLVATARRHDLRFITENRKILDYGRQGYLRAHATDDKGFLNP